MGRFAGSGSSQPAGSLLWSRVSCALAADGDGTRRVCLSVWEMDGPCEIVVLDSSGKERARRAWWAVPTG